MAERLTDEDIQIIMQTAAVSHSIDSDDALALFREIDALRSELAAETQRADRLAAAIEAVIQKVTEDVSLCRELVDHTFCEDFGCFDLLEIADRLRAALQPLAEGGQTDGTDRS
jgi:hypothetical protein